MIALICLVIVAVASLARDDDAVCRGHSYRRRRRRGKRESSYNTRTDSESKSRSLGASGDREEVIRGSLYILDAVISTPTQKTSFAPVCARHRVKLNSIGSIPIAFRRFESSLVKKKLGSYLFTRSSSFVKLT